MDESRLGVEERRQMSVRSGIARVERDLSELRSDPTMGSASAVASLASSWKALVDLLAIPEAPVRRDCPYCGGPMMRDATRCVHCWKKSSVEPIGRAGAGLTQTKTPRSE